MSEHAPALVGRRISRAHADRDRRLRKAEALCLATDAGQGRAQVALDVDRERLHRGDVQDARPRLRGGLCRGLRQHHPPFTAGGESVEGPEEGGERLARAGGGNNEGVAASADGRPGTLLCRGGFCECSGEPCCGRGGELRHRPILCPSGAARPVGQTVRMRLTDFWERMDAVFGPEYARSWARDFSISALDGRTVMQAIDAGIDTREIWDAVCGVVEVPALLR